MVLKLLVFGQFWILVTGWSKPHIDCSSNQNTKWCGMLLRKKTQFCITKMVMSFKICRQLWCINCPIQYENELERLKNSKLTELVQVDMRWKEAKTKFHNEFKKYGLGDEMDPDPNRLSPKQVARYENFLNNIDEIEEIKKEVDEPIEFELDINKFSFMSSEEKKSHTGADLPQVIHPKDPPRVPKKWRDKVSINGGTDWRPALKSVEDIKDQGFCGSCWAFTATQVMESFYELASGGVHINFSPQNLIDCSSDGINKGCDGGLPHFAFQYMKDHGISTLEQYPYTSFRKHSGKNPCSHSGDKVKTFINDFDYFFSGDTDVNSNFDFAKSDEELMKILDVMPVAGAIASRRIFNYNKGIYNNKKCLGPLNHAVLIAGYGTSETGVPYWIIKNTWGNSWGEDGFMRVKRGGYCGIGQYWTIPKNLNLCGKFDQNICQANSDCLWYGEYCGINPSLCTGQTTKVSCGFFDCYWKKDTKNCLAAGAKCTMDATVGANEISCGTEKYCQWYGEHCDVRRNLCIGQTSQTSCGLFGCYWNSQTSSCHGPISKCSMDTVLNNINNKLSCDGEKYCEWYGESCDIKISLCTAQTSDIYCNLVGCYWNLAIKHCLPRTAKCAMETYLGNKVSCNNEKYCEWYGQHCDIKRSLCAAQTDKNSCGVFGCFWKSNIKHCLAPTAKCTLSKKLQANNNSCNGEKFCEWYGEFCGMKRSLCTAQTSQILCDYFGCFWKSDKNQCISPTAKCTMDTVLQENKLSCDGEKYCEWYGVSCDIKRSLCTLQINETTCDKFGCYWETSQNQCLAPTEKCTMDPTLNDTEISCNDEKYCKWYGELCDIQPNLCNAQTSETSCQFFGCYWKAGANHCLAPTAKCTLDSVVAATETSCNGEKYCEWVNYKYLNSRCQVKQTVCAQDLTLPECETKSKFQLECEAVSKDSRKTTFLWNSCVVFNRNRKNFDQAKSSCDLFEKGHLLYMTNKEKMRQIEDFLSSLNPSTNDQFWIGLKQFGTWRDEPKGAWKWLKANGIKENTGYETPCGSGQPDNNLLREHCGTYWWKIKAINDYECKKDIPFICQFGWSEPKIDCAKNQNGLWCKNLLRRGSDFFCVTKSAVTMAVCKKMWCQNCPQQVEGELLNLKKGKLSDMIQVDLRWKEVKVKFQKEFVKFGLENLFDPSGATEDQIPRYENYLNSIDEIEAIKTEVGEPHKFEMDINKFSFMNEDERKGHTGLNVPDTLKARAAPPITEKFKNLVKINGGTDWRPALKSVKDIKDQGFCGSCWAFTASQAMDSFYELASGVDPNFSPQELIDCSSNGINKGCDGGMPHFAFEYIKTHGLTLNDNYPYISYQRKSGKDGCNNGNVAHLSYINDFDYFYNGDPNVNPNFDSTESDKRLMEMLDVMPVAGAIASNRIFPYSKGIYNNKNCLGPLNHAVLIVGYGTEGAIPYWIIKNSWGQTWGEGGFMRIKRGNYCGVGQYWAIPKQLSLCERFPDQKSCISNWNCEWYGESCDVKGAKCPSYIGKTACEYFGCFWQSDSKSCLPPTAKCIFENSIQDPEKCNAAKHCQWEEYKFSKSRCEIKATTCAFQNDYCEKKSKLQLECEAVGQTDDNKTAFLWNTCIIVDGIKKNFDAASTSCTLFDNGHLIYLPTADKLKEIDNFLSKLSPSVGASFWIGLKQFASSPSEEPRGGWKWLKSNGVKEDAGNATPWTSGQPDNFQSAENCATVWWKTKAINDYNCGQDFSFICQFEEKAP